LVYNRHMSEAKDITILSYEHEGSVEPYCLETLGEDFEINVPPENVLMALCAHHEARILGAQGVNVVIQTVGGCAESNTRIIEKLNEITESDIPVYPNTESNSTASNIESLKGYPFPFVVVCQNFAKSRANIHANYQLGKDSALLIGWEEYFKRGQFSEKEIGLISEVWQRCHVPIQRKLIEKGFLLPLAIIDPEHGGTTVISSLREKLRKKNPTKNIFNKTGLS